MACLRHSFHKSPNGSPVRVQQSGASVEKAPGRGELEAKEKKVKILEHQRREVRMGLGGSPAVSRVRMGDGRTRKLGQCGETGTGLRSRRDVLLGLGSSSSWTPR